MSKKLIKDRSQEDEKLAKLEKLTKHNPDFFCYQVIKGQKTLCCLFNGTPRIPIPLNPEKIQIDQYWLMAKIEKFTTKINAIQKRILLLEKTMNEHGIDRTKIDEYKKEIDHDRDNSMANHQKTEQRQSEDYYFRLTLNKSLTSIKKSYHSYINNKTIKLTKIPENLRKDIKCQKFFLVFEFRKFQELLQSKKTRLASYQGLIQSCSDKTKEEILKEREKLKKIHPELENYSLETTAYYSWIYYLNFLRKSSQNAEKQVPNTQASNKQVPKAQEPNKQVPSTQVPYAVKTGLPISNQPFDPTLTMQLFNLYRNWISQQSANPNMVPKQPPSPNPNMVPKKMVPQHMVPKKMVPNPNMVPQQIVPQQPSAPNPNMFPQQMVLQQPSAPNPTVPIDEIASHYNDRYKKIFSSMSDFILQKFDPSQQELVISFRPITTEVSGNFHIVNIPIAVRTASNANLPDSNGKRLKTDSEPSVNPS